MRFFLAGIVGFIVTVVLLSAAREVALADRTFAEMLASTLHWLGSFQWVYDYQTLIALVGAWWAASAVYAQIRQADRAEFQKKQTRKASLRAVLPFTLSSLSEYADLCATLLEGLIDKCEENVLPATVPIPEFPEVPSTALSAVAHFIEVADVGEAQFLAIMLASLQVQSARLIGLRKDHIRPEHITLQLNLERYIVDVAEVHAQASALYSYARQRGGAMPNGVSRGDVGTAVPLLGIYDDLRNRLVERYGLEGNEQWIPPFAMGPDA